MENIIEYKRCENLKYKRCENVKSKRCENVKKINAAFENPKKLIVLKNEMADLLHLIYLLYMFWQ
jgi:hypothetical protein